MTNDDGLSPWLPSRCPFTVCILSRSPADRSLPFSVAFIQMAGFAGSNVFKAKDAPRYKDGLIVCGVCSVVGGIIMLVWKLLYIWDEKRAQGDRRGGTSPGLVSLRSLCPFSLCVCALKVNDMLTSFSFAGGSPFLRRRVY